MFQRVVFALILAAAIFGTATPAHAIDTVPLPERPAYRVMTPMVPMFSLQRLPGILL